MRKFTLAYYPGSSRLFLQTITEVSADGQTLPPHKFEYDPQTLPERDTKSTDHWGYYTGKTNTTNLPSLYYPYNYNGSSYVIDHAGADRSPSFAFAKGGILKKIIYPTGGRTDFEYEANDYGTVGSSLVTWAPGPPIYAHSESRGANGYDSEIVTIENAANPSDPIQFQIQAFYNLSQPTGIPYAGHLFLEVIKLITGGGEEIVFQQPVGDLTLPSDQDPHPPAQERYYQFNLLPGQYRIEVKTKYGPNPTYGDPTYGDIITADCSWKNNVAAKSRIGGGLRIKSIATNDAINSASIIREFKYILASEPDRSSGVIITEPRYYYTQLYNSGTNCHYISLSSSSRLPLGSSQGSYVGYREVKEIRQDVNLSGYTIHKFYTAYDFPDNIATEDNWPFGLITSYDWKRGNLISTSDYNSAGVLQRKTDYTYTFCNLGDPACAEGDPTTKVFRALAFSTGFPGALGTLRYGHKYTVISAWTYPTGKTVTRYDQNGQNPVATTETYFYGNSNHLQLTKTIETNSDNLQRITEFNYAHEKFTQMADPGIHKFSQLYSTIVKKGTTDVESKKWITWRVDGGYWRPNEEWTWKGDGSTNDLTAPADPGDGETLNLLVFDTYDSYGNLMQVTDVYSTPTTTLWGYNGSLPIARIGNALPSQSAVSIFDDNNLAVWSGTSGTWTINAGVYQQTNAAAVGPWANPKYLNTASFDDGIFEAEVRFDETAMPKYLGLSKWLNSTNFVRFELHRIATGSLARIYAKKDAANATINANKTFTANQWYRLRGEIQGSTAKLYLDGELLATLDNTNVDHGAGYVGLCTNATQASFDNVRLYPHGALAFSLSFDPLFFKINAQSDENGNRRFFSYDNFGRLQTITDALGRVVQEHSYFYSNPFSATNPNYVQAARSTHAEHVRNQSFEEGTTTPASWAVTTFGAGVAGTWDNTISFSGAKSLKASITTPGAGNRVRWDSWYDEKVSPQKSYRMEVWAKTSTNYNGLAAFSLFFHDAQHNVLSSELKKIFLPNTADQWQKVTLDFTPSANVDHVYAIYLDFEYNGVGTVWYDRANFYELNTTQTFADGLGREAQTQQHEGAGAIKTATLYDDLSRVQKVIKPYPSATQAFAANPTADANSYYNSNHPAYYDGVASQEYDTNPYAYTETEYYADPLDRVKRQAAPGTAFRMGTGKEVKFDYLTNGASDVSGYSANTLLKQRRTDEDGKITDSFTDRFGNNVATIIDPGTPPSVSNYTTTFKYDVLGNLLESKDPRTLLTTYAYTTLSQLRQKDAPDDNGLTEYLYDKNSNLRFVKDAKGATGNTYFIYYKYDSFNRQIEEGTMTNPTANFNQTNADNTGYPGAGNTWKMKYYYDSSPDLSLHNLKGRLYRLDYTTDRYPAMTGYIFYSYDANGNVERIDQNIPKSNVNDGNGYFNVTIDYQYDALSKVTKTSYRRTFPPGVSSDAFYTWYDYDALGRLEKVFTNTEDAKLTTANATYVYWPGGQMRRLVLGNTLQGMDYLYNSRDWLTQINHQNLTSSGDPGGDGGGGLVPNTDRFGQILGYDKRKHLANIGAISGDFIGQYNGNISWTIFRTNGNNNPAPLTGWVFQYDQASRLAKANWGHYSGGWIEPDNRYDLTGITYDANGNFLTMTRRNETSAATNMIYNYTTGTNKLHQVSGLNGQGANNYTYDANGNMIKDLVKLGSGSTITYDYRNLPQQVPKSVSPAGTIDFGYDAKGQRVSKNNQFYIYGADGKVLAVYDNNGTLLYWNIWGLDLIGQRFWKQ